MQTALTNSFLRINGIDLFNLAYFVPDVSLYAGPENVEKLK